MAAGILVLLIGTGLVARGVYSRRPPAAAGPKMLAVLPFENLGPAEDEYFADGLTEEITSRLASVSGLGVISRTSAMHYKKTTSSLKEVGRELGAGYVLEGSVRWEKLAGGRSRIRVTPQLIEVSDDRHLWADRYDAELADIFQVQGQIAAAVTLGLDVALRTSERADLAAKPTVNPEAYLYYLRANERAEHQGFSNLAQADSAVQLYEQAIALDPRFAVAYAELSQLQSAVYFSYYDRTTERLGKARAALDSAVRLQPDLPETHLALGRYYQRVSLDYDRALAEFTKVLSRQPNNSDALWALGRVQRRQGKQTEGIVNMKRATALDPRDWGKNSGIADADRYLRAYAEAIQYWDRAIALRPDVPDFYAGKALTYLAWDGTADRARQVVREALTRVELGRLASVLFVYGWGYDFLIVLADVPPDSLARLPLAAFAGDTGYYLNFKSQVHNFRHELEPMRHFAGSARTFYEQKSKADPEDPFFHMLLGFVDAELGRKGEAIREGERAVALRPVTKDAQDGPVILNLVGQIYMMVGEPEKAIERVQYLLSIPSGLSAPLLRVDPVWDPLRGNPRFERLAAGK
jgi:serine/threonine-protein kinase